MLLPTYTLLITLLLISFHDSEQFLPLLSRCPCHETKPDQIGRSGLLVLLSQSNNGNDQSLDNNNNNNNNKQQKKKGKSKSKKIVINTKLVGEYNISSDGLLTNRKTKQKEAKEARDAVKSNLGVPGRKKKPSSNNDKSSRKLSKKAQKLKDERTAYGTVDGTLQAGLAVPEDQEIQVQEVKRGNKQVTIVRYVHKRLFVFL